MADKSRRLERIRAAKAQLEAEAASDPADLDPADLDPDGPGPSSGMRERGARKTTADGPPPDKAQRNFTDADSRIQPTRDGFIAGFNAQIAVDAERQIIVAQLIVAQRLATNPADVSALIPLVDQAKANLGRKLKEVSGDSGFASEPNIAAMNARRIRAYLAPGRSKHASLPAAGEPARIKQPLMAAMAKKLERAGRASRDRLRKQTVEPVFGQIKQARGFRQFLLRGLANVRAEWTMICTVHNLIKLAKAS